MNFVHQFCYVTGTYYNKSDDSKGPVYVNYYQVCNISGRQHLLFQLVGSLLSHPPSLAYARSYGLLAMGTEAFRYLCFSLIIIIKNFPFSSLYFIVLICTDIEFGYINELSMKARSSSGEQREQNLNEAAEYIFQVTD